MVSKLSTICYWIVTSVFNSFASSIIYVLNSFLGVVDDPKVHAQLKCTVWMTIHTAGISFELTGRQQYFEVGYNF